MPKIVREPIYHEGTFRAILYAATRARCCLRYRGQSWEPIEQGRGYGLYRRAPFDLRLIQDRVEGYQFFVYSQLLQNHFGRDGVLRPRARLRRAPNGAYRPRRERAQLSSPGEGLIP